MGKKRLLMAIAAGALAMGMSSAGAADIEPVVEPAGWYVSLFGGASFLEDVETEYDYGISSSLKNKAETETGFIVGGAIGTHLTDDIRVELEVAYSENDVDKIHYSGPYNNGTYDAKGSFGILTFMGNLWYDIPLSETLNPYLGGGVGLAIVDGETTYEPDDGDDSPYDSSEVAFAFQLGAGLRWKAFENITFDVGYRLRGIDGPDFGNSDFPQSSNYDGDMIFSHNVIAGVSFGL